MTTAQNVARWLQTFTNVRDARPCRVTIGNSTWEGAAYTQVHQWQVSMDGVTRGEHKVGDEYLVYRIYLLGDAPWTERVGQCFPYEGRDWFVTGYFKSTSSRMLPEIQRHYHPFGTMFMLGPWDVPGSKIDDGARAPYHRTPLTVEYQDA